MNVKFKKPKIEPVFQAEIYHTRHDNQEEYRVVIGREGTEVPPKVGKFIDYHAISDFTNKQGIESWVSEKVHFLEKEGKRVIFDESPSYLIARAAEELASKSPSSKSRTLIFQINMN